MLRRILPSASIRRSRSRSLNFFYGASQALFDVTVALPERAVTALIGPSGCGKSTFLRTLNRMNEIIEGTRVTGSVFLEGTDIYQPAIDVVSLRKRVGMVFQKSTPFPKSIFENVAYGQRIAGQKNRKTLAEPGRGVPQAGRPVGRGQGPPGRFGPRPLQRPAAAALHCQGAGTNPEVLLMDEPASALDPASTARVEDLIFELKRNYTIVIVTHNMQQAARISDRTAFFNHGHLIEIDATQKIFTRPGQKQTEEYITGRFG